MYSLLVTTRKGTQLSIDCASRTTVAEKANLVREQGIIDDEGNIYSPSEITLISCPDLISNQIK